MAVIGHTYVVDANRGKWRALANRCDAVRLYVPSVWPEPDFWTRECEAASDLDIVSLPAKDAGRARRWRLPFRKLREDLVSFRPDIIHVEAEAGSAVAIESACLRGRSAMTQFVWENIPIASAWRRALSRWNVARVDHLFCGSEGALNAARSDGYRGPATVVAQVGVDPMAGDRARAKREFDDGRFTVGYVGRTDQKKGVHVLFNAFARLGDIRTGLVYLGDGPERSELRRRVALVGESERVRFVDPVPHDRVAEHVKGFDVLVLPSISTPGWKEQFGHVLIEAMACGVPVIGSRCGAIPEVIGDAGIVVDEGNATALAEAIGRLMTDVEERGRLARVGRFRVRDRFTDAAIAEVMYRAWKELVDGHGSLR
ncbi:MAG: glycosyltransferase family 4 protein [Deltaproteobacteria bacterium]|nr:glycosyltransferase family 4 protein [Deltaproteobacteria bacterium]